MESRKSESYIYKLGFVLVMLTIRLTYLQLLRLTSKSLGASLMLLILAQLMVSPMKLIAENSSLSFKKRACTFFQPWFSYEQPSRFHHHQTPRRTEPSHQTYSRPCRNLRSLVRCLIGPSCCRRSPRSPRGGLTRR